MDIATTDHRLMSNVTQMYKVSGTEQQTERWCSSSLALIICDDKMTKQWNMTVVKNALASNDMT